MFTGIVQGQAEVLSISGSNKLKTFTIKFPKDTLTNVVKGASIALNGTCLTVTSFDLDQNLATFDVMFETLRFTNLGSLCTSDKINFERAASIGDEIGGHLMSGHIYCSVEISRISATDETYSIYFSMPQKAKKYILPKGFVGLNGCSLTIGDVDEHEFSVHLIPETLGVTTFGALSVGASVNLEIDPQTQTIVDTVERLLESKKPA